MFTTYAGLLPGVKRRLCDTLRKEFLMRLRFAALSVMAVSLMALSLCSFCGAQTSPAGPLIVDEDSHVVVTEYENWFGPDAVTFQGTAAVPFLQSADMQSVGGGYDSADPAVIQKHVEWFEYLGIDAALIDLTNNVSCIFNTPEFAEKYLTGCNAASRVQNLAIQANTGNTYPSFTNLGTSIKLIPLLGGSEPDVLQKDLDGKNSFEKEIEYFGSLMGQYPDRVVIYQGKPLMVIFVGAAQDPYRPQHAMWLEIKKFLAARPDLTAKYTFRQMAGYLDSQPYLWVTPGHATGPEQIKPYYNFWSWVDRLNPTCTSSSLCPYFPTYNIVGSRVENMTVSIATAGENGWGCPDSPTRPYCPDDSLRYGPHGSYATFTSFMDHATQLDPIFLFIHQFNEFVKPDEGFDANTDDDIEPANLWGDDLNVVKEQIALYRRRTRNTK